MINVHWVILGSALSVLGGSRYVVNTWRGDTAPNRISWGIWLIVGSIAFAAQIQKGVGLQAALNFTTTLVVLIILVVSLHNPNSYWKLNKLDYFCGALAIAAVVAWRVTNNGDWAIIFVIIASVVAAIPTVLKAISHPASETPWAFGGNLGSAIITLLTISKWTFAVAALPIMIGTVNCAIFSAVVIPRKTSEAGSI